MKGISTLHFIKVFPDLQGFVPYLLHHVSTECKKTPNHFSQAASKHTEQQQLGSTAALGVETKFLMRFKTRMKKLTPLPNFT